MKKIFLLAPFAARTRQRLRRIVVASIDAALFYLTLLSLALCCMVWSGLAAVLTFLLPRQCAQKLGRLVIMRLFAALFGFLNLSGRFRFDFSALDCLKEEKSLIIAANHPALWDAVMIVSRLPNVVCVMKEDVVGNIFLGRGARLAGYIRNESARQVISRAVAELRCGSHVLLFPEGTRTVTSPVNPFKGGIGIIARHANAAVQTVFIETDTPFLGKGWAMLKKPALPITCRLRLGRRFQAGASAAAITAQLEQYFMDELDGLPAGHPAESKPAGCVTQTRAAQRAITEPPLAAITATAPAEREFFFPDAYQ